MGRTGLITAAAAGILVLHITKVAPDLEVLPVAVACRD
jgi:hypothetical protein